MSKWFKNALTFSCTACGKCCKSKGSNKVFLNLAETQAIADHTGLSVQSFDETYTENRIDGENRVLKTIKQHNTKKQCVFLEGNRCGIYEVRPTQCRTYPFWPQNMIGPAEWIAESHLCEGIKVTKTLSSVASRFPREVVAGNSGRGDDSVIALNMLTHQIHDRGRGENWTYEQTIDLLNLTKGESSELLDEYLDSFFSSNESRVEYESASLRVVDSKCVDHGADEQEQLDEVSPEYSRRMEFVSSPQLAQTEISFTVSPQDRADGAVRSSVDDKFLSPHFDYTSLRMPVHRVIGDLAAAFLQGCSHPDRRVAVIGAGCCALPAYLLTQFPSSLVVHAVEPAGEVLAVADSHFGMSVFTPDRLARHVLDGAAFLEQHPSATFDVVIIDAFESAPVDELSELGLGGASDDDGAPTVIAPPLSLLNQWGSWARSIESATGDVSGVSGGLLVVNVFGPDSWVEHVRTRIELSNLFCSVRRLETVDAVKLESINSSDSRNVVLATMPKSCEAFFTSFFNK